jgi:hypothetical protein
MPVGEIRAAIGPKTLNDETRSVEIQWTTGERGIRQGWSGPFYEELGMKPSQIRMSRAKAGLPFSDGHQSWDNDRTLGIVENITIEKNGEMRIGSGRVRFDTHELAERRFNSVKNGILRDVSVGYRVYKYDKVEEVEENGIKIPVYRAVDWEPIEISLVTAGFDTKAKIRSGEINDENVVEVSDSDESGLCENVPQETRTIERSSDMPLTEVAPPVEQVDVNAVRTAAISAERARVREISEDCHRAGFADLANGFINDGVSPDAVRSQLLIKVSERTAAVNSSRATITRDESETRFEGMAEAVMHRANSRRHALTEKGRAFVGFTLADLARALTGATGSNLQVVTEALTNRAYQTTSSFSNLLEDIQTKTLRAEYEANVASFEPFVRRSTLPDFKPGSRARLGDMQDLLLLPEGAEFQVGESSDSTEKIQLLTYGRKIGLSRQAIVNDDLDAFARLPTQFAMKARNLEANLVYGALVTNANMSDGVALFNAAGHGNRATVNAVINVLNLGIGIADMRRQTSETGMPLNIFPRFLVVPPALEAVARQYTTQITPAVSANVNPYQGTFQLVVDPRLETLAGGSLTRWYLICDPSQVDTIELASLAGGESVNVEKVDDANSLGVWWRAYIDRGVKAIDWRGMWDNLGA